MSRAGKSEQLNRVAAFLSVVIELPSLKESLDDGGTHASGQLLPNPYQISRSIRMSVSCQFAKKMGKGSLRSVLLCGEADD